MKIANPVFRVFTAIILAMVYAGISSATAWSATGEVQISEQTTLSKDQIELIQDKSFFKDGFSIRVATGEVDGIKRTVVFMGETHFKTKNVLRKTEVILNKFEMYGTEGVDLEQYWGNAKALNVMLGFIDAILRPIFESSTIHSVEEKAFSKDSQNPNLPPPPVVVELENGYKPGLQDNLAVLLMPLTFAATIVTKCLSVSCQKWPSFLMLQRVRSWPTQITKAIMVYLAIDIFSRLMFDEEKWQDNIFIFSTGILYHRNEYMTESVIKGFQANPEKQNILVITGAMHQSGMMKLLKNQYQFNEVNIDEVQVQPVIASGPGQ
jgi:hypothetical protein